MELKDTVELMNSNDYKDRLLAEYQQGVIRWSKLYKKILECEAGTFTPSFPVQIFQMQCLAMDIYLCALELRAETDGVKLGLMKRERNQLLNNIQ